MFSAQTGKWCAKLVLKSYWPIPCIRKMGLNFQISQHELKPIFIGSSTSQVSENNGYYASVLDFHFSGIQKAGTVVSLWLLLLL